MSAIAATVITALIVSIGGTASASTTATERSADEAEVVLDRARQAIKEFNDSQFRSTGTAPAQAGTKVATGVGSAHVLDETAVVSGDVVTLEAVDHSLDQMSGILEDGTILYEGDDIDHALAAFEDGSFRAETIIRGPAAPREIAYDITFSEGTHAEIADDGGVDVFEVFADEPAQVLVGRFETPWAIDASGTPIDTWYELDGGSLVQVVDHGVDTAYPVVADPFWIPAIVVALRVASVTIKVGSKTVKYAKAPASRAANALSSYKTLSFKTGAHTFKLDKSGMKHILTRHHPKYWTGGSKATQTFFNPNMSVTQVRSLVHGAMKQWPATLKSRGTNQRISLSGTYDGVKYKMVIDKGRVVQFYPR
ncbi:hypothetical protein GCM10009718_16090 [Isoptericola halotolerans]